MNKFLAFYIYTYRRKNSFSLTKHEEIKSGFLFQSKRVIRTCKARPMKIMTHLSSIRDFFDFMIGLE